MCGSADRFIVQTGLRFPSLAYSVAPLCPRSVLRCHLCGKAFLHVVRTAEHHGTEGRIGPAAGSP